MTESALARSKEQLDALIDFAQALGKRPFIEKAPPEALAALDQGLAEIRNGQTVAGPELFDRLDEKLRAHGA